MAAAQHDPRSKGRRRQAIVVAAFVPGAIEATHDLARGNPVDLASLALLVLGAFALLAALTATFDRCMSWRLTNAWCFVLPAAVAIGVGVAECFLALVIGRALDIALIAPMHRGAATLARMGAIDGLLGLGLWAMAVVLPFAVSDARARAREAERLRTAAELARLRANLQPHFLFNTLSTVAGLIGEDPREARKLIGALGDLLRDSLVDADEMQSLDDEVRWLRRYAAILETRHRGSITFRWEIVDEARSVRLPRLLLQPLLENAVKHGALRRTDGGEVVVRATMTAGGEGRLVCVVEDNGPGAPPRATRPGARGIDLVTRRLALKYAGAAEFRFESRDGLTRSIVELPREAAT